MKQVITIYDKFIMPTVPGVGKLVRIVYVLGKYFAQGPNK